MKTAELLARIEQLENEPQPDKEDWFDLLYGNIPTIKEALSNIKQIQSDAQKHGEQIGWEKGMAEASEIAIKCISRQFSAHYHGASLIIRDSIIEARDKNQNKL